MKSALRSEVKSRKSYTRANGLVLISGGFSQTTRGTDVQPALLVSQVRLAKIQELQSRAEFSKHELLKEWQDVRESLLKGARIEHGPIRAWIEREVVMRRGQKGYVRLRLRVV